MPARASSPTTERVATVALHVQLRQPSQEGLTGAAQRATARPVLPLDVSAAPADPRPASAIPARHFARRRGEQVVPSLLPRPDALRGAWYISMSHRRTILSDLRTVRARTGLYRWYKCRRARRAVSHRHQLSRRQHPQRDESVASSSSRTRRGADPDRCGGVRTSREQLVSQRPGRRRKVFLGGVYRPPAGATRENTLFESYRVTTEAGV